MDIKKIMIVEDDPDIALIARFALESLGGYKVTVCADGKKALENIDEEKPDLILMDVMMPGMDGPETLLKIREKRGTNIPVIFLTAKVQPKEVEYYKSIGAMDVIAKPFDPMKLHEQIYMICNNFREIP